VTAALEFRSVSASYGSRGVLSDISTGFAAGAVTGIVGPNGAGKTTLFRVALGLIKPSSGTIDVLDKPLAQWSREGLARAVAYLPQGSDAHWPLQTRQLVALGRLPHRAAFAALSASDAGAIDEPAAYLDPAHQLRLMELLREEAARGTAVAVTLHDLALASRHCDEIIVLDKGRLIGEGAPQDALSDALLARVFGIAAMHTPDPMGGRPALTPWRRL